MTHTIRVLCRVVAGFALVAVTTRAEAQVPPPVQTPPPAAATPVVRPPAGPADYVFPSGAGLVFYYVKTPKASDFEQIVGRIREALAKAESSMLKQQALNWRIYKSAEPATDATVFVFAFDPAIATASYDPLLLLAEVLPAEVQPLYDRLKDAVIKIERMGLTKIR